MKRIFYLLVVFAIAVSAVACSDAQKGQNTADKETAVPAANEPNTEMDVKMQSSEQEEENSMKLNIQIGEKLLTATLVHNSSAEALLDLLSEGPVTISMSDYASMEKVGQLPKSLPRNDEQISTGAGDLILYQGNSFVIYYDTNSWDLTRLGKIDQVTQRELMGILGDGDVTAVLSIPEK